MTTGDYIVIITFYVFFGWIFTVWFVNLFLDGKWAGGHRVTVLNAIFIHLCWLPMGALMLLTFILTSIFKAHPLRRLYFLDED